MVTARSQTPAPAQFTITSTNGGGGSTSLGQSFPADGAGTVAQNGVPTVPPAQKLAKILRTGAVRGGKVTATEPAKLTSYLMLGRKRLAHITKLLAQDRTVGLSFRLSGSGKRALRRAGKHPRLSVQTTFDAAATHESIRTTRRLTVS